MTKCQNHANCYTLECGAHGSMLQHVLMAALAFVGVPIGVIVLFAVIGL
jgi:hypothetical protein